MADHNGPNALVNPVFTNAINWCIRSDSGVRGSKLTTRPASRATIQAVIAIDSVSDCPFSVISTGVSWRAFTRA